MTKQIVKKLDKKKTCCENSLQNFGSLLVECDALLKPGLYESQLPVKKSVTLVSSIVVERCRCAFQVSSVARLQENKET